MSDHARTRDATAVTGAPGFAVHTGRAGRPVVVGEVLFDVFPDGSRRLGGAPFNVAWHLQGLGLEPLLVTRIGLDPEGDEILDAMSGWGLDTAAVQRDPDLPTGKVRVTLDGGEPSFHILPDQAWDNLDGRLDLSELAGGPPCVIYHGTLITRSEASREALYTYRGRTGAPVFLDVNLRPPWWTEAEVARALLGTRWVKLNTAELAALGGGEPDPAAHGLEEAAVGLRRRHALDTVIVTRGEAGALVFREGVTLRGSPPIAVRSGDPVGAGDAFSAAFLAGLVHGWPLQTTLDRAIDLAAAMCAVHGAVTDNRRLYHKLLEL
jgi:fructokinase